MSYCVYGARLSRRLAASTIYRNEASIHGEVLLQRRKRAQTLKLITAQSEAETKSVDGSAEIDAIVEDSLGRASHSSKERNENMKVLGESN